jgi:hypothetical protein
MMKKLELNPVDGQWEVSEGFIQQTTHCFLKQYLPGSILNLHELPHNPAKDPMEIELIFHHFSDEVIIIWRDSAMCLRSWTG